MNINKIKSELEKKGFFAGIKNEVIQAGMYRETDNETGIISLDKSFRVSINENKINLEYSYGQIPIEKTFKTIKELLNYLTDSFLMEEQEL